MFEVYFFLKIVKGLVGNWSHVYPGPLEKKNLVYCHQGWLEVLSPSLSEPTVAL